MRPLSDALLDLLDRISAALAEGVAPQPLLAELESCWHAERPDDRAGLATLMKDLCVRPNEARLAEVESEHLRRRSFLAAEVGARAQVAAREGQPQHAEEGWLYPVFFATNRAPNDPDSPTDGFSGRRGTSVNYGRCQVWIPRTHHFGETGNPFWQRWRRFEFADDHLHLRETEILSDASFWGALQEQMKQADDGRPNGLVYLHGYNVAFHDAIIRGAQIGFDLRVSGATAIFSWPSQGTLKGYPADTAAIEASESAISHFLTDFARRSGAEVVHVIAHSMGNRGLLRSLQRIAADAELAAGVRFGQIFLAAPDVDRDLFVDLARLYPEFSDRTTLYASPMDRAVEASAWLHEAPRAGYLPPVTVVHGADRLDTVEVPGFNLDAMGHGYFAEAEGVLYDMADLMRHGTPPPRTRLDQDSTDGHWVMRP